ncbi:MAG: pantoate--beta-alanine ligase [Verrucomicrobium sp.]|nr:pantoate--beta-alanine ligase [Verrucomicrobium sp.]
MKTVSDPALMQRTALAWRRRGVRIALVPTMGALHAGHARLIEVARQKAGKKGKIVVSIYVNPTQFGPREDLTRYPRPRRADLALCRKLGVDLVFAPGNLYAPGHSTWVTEEALSEGRCGASRPGHFRGVTTVVTKLFTLVQPDLACFGWKDAQQLEVVTRMARDLNLPVRIVPVETVRDRDGLALSSRNRYLSPEERQRALAIPLLLRVAAGRTGGEAWLRRHLAKAPGLKLDYVTLSGGRLCVAAWVGKTRLLDNVPCPVK